VAVPETLLSAFPETDFYGMARLFPTASAGAVQYDDIPPVLSDGYAERWGETSCYVIFNTSEAGTVYYKIVPSGDKY